MCKFLLTFLRVYTLFNSFNITLICPYSLFPLLSLRHSACTTVLYTAGCILASVPGQFFAIDWKGENTGYSMCVILSQITTGCHGTAFTAISRPIAFTSDCHLYTYKCIVQLLLGFHVYNIIITLWLQNIKLPR